MGRGGLIVGFMLAPGGGMSCMWLLSTRLWAAAHKEQQGSARARVGGGLFLAEWGMLRLT